jgi:two-component system, chemotaxis family, protein-glutamate methylesterase/glutaminase
MSTPYLTFRLQGAWYAVEASRVREILQLPALTPVAEVPSYIIGVVNYRGHILPVMDLGIRLGQPRRSYHIHDHVIVLEQASRRLGILVNEVHGVQEIPPETTETCAAFAASDGGGSRIVRHLAKLDTTAIMILDHALLLSPAAEPYVDLHPAALEGPEVNWPQSTGPVPADDGLHANPSAPILLFFHHAAAWEREVLFERARNLTSSLEEQSTTDQLPLAIVGLSGEYFGVELETVCEFTDLQRLTPVPCCPAYVVGDMNLRGDILTVVDIRQALQMVVGKARSGREALELIPRLQPAVVCTDLHMPDMDGLQLTKEIMGRFARPILVVSAAVHPEDAQNVFRLLEAGAVDILPKPRGGLAADEQRIAQELIRKIKIISGVVALTRRQQVVLHPVQLPDGRSSPPKSPRPRIIAIGASTGGPPALHTIFAQLPADFPAPILCVQHISDGFLGGLVEWLATHCVLSVKIAQSWEQPLPGTIYFPQEGAHLEIDKGGKLVCSQKAPIDGHRPSVTVTFKSVADYCGEGAVGVLLTGMGSDGAQGMQAIFEAGGITIAQNEESSVVFGMPKQAIALGAVKYVLPVSKIAFMLPEILGASKRG